MGTPGTASITLTAYADFPSELAAYAPFTASPSYRFGYAILFYSGDYSATNTFGQVIYWWVAMAQDPISHVNFLMIGNAFVPDADVSTTASVHLVHAFGTGASPYDATKGLSGLFPQFEFHYNQLGQNLVQTNDDGIGGAEVYLQNQFGGSVLAFNTDLFLDQGVDAIVGGGVAAWSDPGGTNNAIAQFPDLSVGANANAGVAGPNDGATVTINKKGGPTKVIHGTAREAD